MQEYLVDTILIVAILVSGGVLLWLLDYAEEKGEYLVEALILPKPVLVVHNSQHAENQKSLVNKMIGRIRALDTEATPKKSKKDRKANDIEYSGQVHFPKKVYEGDSKNILINLQSS